MTRTQVYLDPVQVQQLKLEAKKEHTSASDLIRKAVNIFLESKNKKINWDKDPLVKSFGTVKLNVKDASINHDKYLY